MTISNMSIKGGVLTLIQSIVRLGIVVSLIIALLALLGRFEPALDAVTHFRPFLAAGTAVLVAVALLLRYSGRKAMLVYALAALVLHTAPVALEVGSAVSKEPPNQPIAQTTSLRLMTFNMWGRNSETNAVVDYIRRQDLDVVVLQEAFAELRPVVDALGVRFPHRVDCVGKAACNLVILSRFPIISSEIHERRWTKTAPWTVPIVVAEVAPDASLSGETFTIVATHFSWPLPARFQQRQFRQLADVITKFETNRMILAGDFNSTPWSGAFSRFETDLPLQRVTRALPTWPSPRLGKLYPGFSFLPIDHVFIGDALEADNVRRGDVVGSDHYPVIVDLRLNAASATRR